MSNATVKVRIRLEDVMSLKGGKDVLVVSEKQGSEASLPQTVVEAEIPLEELCVVGSRIRIVKNPALPSTKPQRPELRLVGEPGR